MQWILNFLGIIEKINRKGQFLDEIEVNIQEFDEKKIVNVKILDRVLN